MLLTNLELLQLKAVAVLMLETRKSKRCMREMLHPVLEQYIGWFVTNL